MSGWRRRIAAAIVLVPLGLAPVGVQAAHAQNVGEPYRPKLMSTFHPSAVKLRASAVSPRVAATLPTAVDLTGGTLPAGDQGPVASCVTWAVGYSLLGYYSRTQPHIGAPFAPMYIYSQINGGHDNGSAISDALNLVVSQGIAEKAVYTQGDVDWQDPPTAAEQTNAALHKVSSWSNLFVNWNGPGQAGVNQIKAALAAGHPIVLAMPVYRYPFNSGWWSQTSMPVETLANTSGPMLGYHAVAAFGYNANGLVLENSWGTSWGYHGFAELGWDFVAKYVLEADQITGFATTDLTTPVVTGLSPTTVTGLSGGQSLTVTGTNLAAVTAVSLTPTAGGTSLPATIQSRSATAVTVTLPAAPAAGTYNVRVSTPQTTSTTSSATVLSYLPGPPPTVTRVSPTAVAGTGGGQSLTVTGTNLAAVTSVSLTSTAGGNPLPATILSRSATALTVPLPAVPAAGSYRVVASTGTQQSSTTTSAATVVYSPTPTVRTATGTLLANKGGTITLTGSGFGASASVFTSEALTATVQLQSGTKSEALKYVSDSTSTLPIPLSAAPGTIATVTLVQNGTSLWTGKLPYLASLDSASVTACTASTATLTVRGAGLAGQSRWALGGLALPTFASQALLNAAPYGVLVSSDALATVKIPSQQGPGVGTFTLTLTPDQARYPGSTSVSAVRLTYVGTAAPVVTG